MQQLNSYSQFILKASLVMMVMFNLTISGATEQKVSPNIVLLTIDALRPDHLSCYGYPRNTSPNIDGLAKSGVIFKNAMCSWPESSASCASMLLGTYAQTHQVIAKAGATLPEHWLTVSEVLAQQGYQNGAVSNNGKLSKAFQYNQGFKDFIEIWEKPEKHNCITTTDYVLQWLKNNYKSKFFLWVHYVSPHTRYIPKPPYNLMFLNDPLYRESPDKLLPVKKSYFNAIHVKAYLPGHQNVNYYISQYDGEIAFCDSQLKRIFDWLKKVNIFNNTMIIVSADHGEELGEHGLYFEHGTEVYQATMRVPLVISYPREIKGAKVINDNVTLVDLAPTFLDYCGIEPLSQFEGKSLRSLIEGKSLDRSVIFAEGGYRNKETNNYHSLVYSGDWKLIHRSDGTFQLFNLKQDPNEQLNLYPKETALAEKLTKTLLEWEKKAKPEMAGEKTPQPPKLSEKAIQQLKSLGYID